MDFEKNQCLYKIVRYIDVCVNTTKCVTINRYLCQKTAEAVCKKVRVRIGYHVVRYFSNFDSNQNTEKSFDSRT